MSQLLSEGSESTPASGRLPKWVLGALFGAVVLICCGSAFAVVFLGNSISSFFNDRLKGGEPGLTPTVTIDACDFRDDPTPHAKVRFTLTNRDDVERDYEVDLEVTDEQGRPVGRGTAAVTDIDAGKSVTQEADVYLDVPGAANCRVDGVR